MKNLFYVLLFAAAIFGYLEHTPSASALDSPAKLNSYPQIISAYQNRQSDVQVTGSGVVIKLLPDDLRGSQHQKFIVRISSGLTLLIAHNINLAARINTLRQGDTIEFYGEYEWNSKGGVLHWTHHDPKGHHADGWLKHNGTVYQ